MHPSHHHSARSAPPAPPRLSMDAAHLPPRIPLVVEEVAPGWWLVTIRRGITNDSLITASIDHVAPLADCWRAMVAAVGRDPLTPGGLDLIRRLYPPRQTWPPDTITAMEAAGQLTPWPRPIPP